ncbi:MAG TPA: SDR family oxidoreductase, partial [Dehalococcoidia bacterium]|nr:SDR family oxidoreductase [Dehalococcoidia bacterium]
TGASNGIGKATASALAAMGARVVLVCRDRARGEAARAEIAREAASDAVELEIADLSSQAEIRGLASRMAVAHPRIDVLVNNAGAVNTVRTTTVDGLETTFAVNHLAYFLLTNLLLEQIRAAGRGRIVNVSSRAHMGARIDFDDLQGARRYGGMRAYGQSKLANVLFTYELARRLAGSDVTANCLHPGVVATGFGHNNPGLLKFAVSMIRPFVLDAGRGAETSVYLAASAEVAGVTGQYFAKCKAVRSSPASYDTATAARLWQVSEELTQPRTDAPARGGGA